MSRQVRLDDDVAEQLAKSATRAGGQSLSQAANMKLRQALGMNSTGRPAGTQRATVGGGAHTRRACLHPIGRQLGDRCGVCGATIKPRR